MDFLTKYAFGCILLPIVYLIGFAQRENAENIYKSLGVILYLIGHLFNMIILSIIGFITTQGKVCTAGEASILLVSMINPFSFNFFGAVLDHFICQDYAKEVHIAQFIYCGVQIALGVLITVLVMAVLYILLM